MGFDFSGVDERARQVVWPRVGDSAAEPGNAKSALTAQHVTRKRTAATKIDRLFFLSPLKKKSMKRSTTVNSKTVEARGSSSFIWKRKAWTVDGIEFPRLW